MGTSGSQATAQPGTAAAHAPCRFCGAPLSFTFVDLGMSPLCQTHISQDQLHEMEPFYPLHAYVCDQCFLVQLQEFVTPDEIFTEYAYFSSYSDSWLAHAAAYVDRMVPALALGPASLVVEVGSNDGYLLQYFVARGIPALGVEPARNVAAAAVRRGVTTITEMFGRRAAQALVLAGRRADLLIGNNVLAQVPDLDDFVGGLSLVLAPGGVLTLEFPHLLRLLEENQFDTIYHEHFSYFSLGTVERILRLHGLAVFDVEELPTHGGSLRVFAQRRDTGRRPATDAVRRVLGDEVAAGLTSAAGYEGFQARIDKVKDDFASFLIEARRAGRKVAAYGAAAKGNTLMNYAGVRPDLIAYVVDRNPAKQGRFMPGSRIPIVDEAHLRADRPDDIVLLPWNLRDELMTQLDYVRAWGGRFVTAVPALRCVP